MPRSRNIKPGVTKNHKLAKLPYETRLLFTWLPMFADHKGLLEDIPEKIHAEIFPFPSDRDLDLDNMLQQLHDSEFIIRFEAKAKPGQDQNQTRFIFITNFQKHQNPHKKERDTKSNFPEYEIKSTIPELDQEIPGQVPVEDGDSPADSLNLIPDSLNLIPDSSETANAEQIQKESFENTKHKEKVYKEVDPIAANDVLNYFSREIRFSHSSEMHLYHVRNAFWAGFTKENLIEAMENYKKRQEIDENQKKYWWGVEKFFNVDHIKILKSKDYLDNLKTKDELQDEEIQNVIKQAKSEMSKK